METMDASPGSDSPQFDVVHGTTLWIVTRCAPDIKDRIHRLRNESGRPQDKAFSTVEESFQSSLSVHLLLCHWALEEWRWNLRYLEEKVEDETYLVLVGPIDDEKRCEYNKEDVQYAQSYEDKTNEAIMILESNVDVILALRNFYYDKLTSHPDLPDIAKRSSR
jgi:hypothetical protein